MIHHEIVFTKDTQRNLNDKGIQNQIAHIVGAVGKSLAARGWTLTAHDVTHDGTRNLPYYQHALTDGGLNVYRYELHFVAVHDAPQPPDKNEIRAITKNMATRAKNPLGGKWTLSSIDGQAYETTEEGDPVSIKDFIAYKEIDLPEDFEGPFDHLYGLDSHIGRLKAALEVADMTQYNNRYHVALIGEPGCGKSDICETLADMLPEGSVMKFDATATTAAGAIKQLDEAEILPRVLIVEEIEKVSPEALSFLLALMDMRGEIRKTTARSTIVKDTKILVIATVNNHRLFDNILAGALSSRFSNKLWFHRPAEEVIKRILIREISKVDGDEAWIDPTMEYAREKNIKDPRMIAALCLCGRDGWLDGTYYKMLSETDKPQDYEQEG